MKLLAKTEMTWNEPWFFVIRLRNRKGWILRGLGVLFIAILEWPRYWPEELSLDDL